MIHAFFASRAPSRKLLTLNRKTLSFFEAIMVVGLWSSSPPLIKIAMEELSPLQINGLRYGGTFLLLLPIIWLRSRPLLKRLERLDWIQLAIMGLLGFSLGNTVLYVGLKSLPATTTSFLLNGIPVVTLLLGMVILGEHPRWLQWGGMLLAMVGGFVFFGRRIEITQVQPIILTFVGVFLISIYGLMARGITRGGRIDPVSLTAIPMGFGALLLVAFIGPMPQVSWRVVGILAWLTLINSALGFVIWNHALQSLQAFEISIMGNLMPIGTALLAPFFLGEIISGKAWVGMSISLIGVILVGVGGRSDLFKTRTI
jgi:drug/metabolite transporter (DMT)-like permease